MQLIRRSALRAAASSPSASFFAKSSRSINTSSPFALRLKVQSRISPAAFRRFNSDDASHREEQEAAVVESEDAAPSSATHTEPAADSFGYPNRERGTAFSRPSDSFQIPARILEPSPAIYIGNLLFDITQADVEREFSQFGTIKSCTIATDARGLSKGFGYIQFDTIPQATAAIEAKNQTVLEGRRLVVNYMSKTKRTFRESAPSKTLFIGNLAFEMSDADLNKLFRDIKNVTDVRVAIDRRTGQPRGFAHADFVDVQSAEKAREYLNEKEVYGRRLRVDYSAESRRAAGLDRDGSSGRGDGHGENASF